MKLNVLRQAVFPAIIDSLYAILVDAEKKFSHIIHKLIDHKLIGHKLIRSKFSHIIHKLIGKWIDE